LSKLQPKLLSTLKEYSKEQFFNDVTAGIIVAIIALPLSIALAIASGVTPEKGLYTAIIAGFIISLLGGSRVQIGGPTGAFMVIVYGIVVNYGIEGLTIATILAGLIMILMGIMKFGGVIKYIPYPITTGFTSGIALTIFSSQIKDFLGLSMDIVPVEFLDKWKSYIGAMDTMNIQTVLIGILALVIILAWPRINKKIPGALIALIVTSVTVQLFDLNVATIGIKFGEISSALPKFKSPGFTIEKVKYLIEPAITIAILGSVESLLSAVVSDGMIGGKHRSNMELIAQGVANIMSGFFGGIPATGAIARTVANIKNGGRTPVAGIVHALTLLLILVIFMPLAKMIPLTSLAAVLIIVAYNMSEWREFKLMFKAPKSDILVLLLTFSITVLVDLVKAIEIGMVLSSFLFMKRMSDVTNVNVNDLDASEEDDDGKRVYEENIINTFDGIKVYEINGPFFFGAADKFMAALNEIGDKTNILILRMRNVPAMDATALNAFYRMIDICSHKKINILISGINEQPYSVIEKADLTKVIGVDNFFKTIREAVEYANSELESKDSSKVTSI
jgi:SulP family sulfate permease